MKICGQCAKLKATKTFGKCKTTVDHLRPECKDCQKKYAAAYYRQHQTKLKQRSANYRLVRRYGITLAEYDQLLYAQGGKCAICGRLPKPGRRLAVDHCHNSGHNRALLCLSCNGFLGYIENNPDFIALVKEYIVKHSTSSR